MYVKVSDAAPTLWAQLADIHKSDVDTVASRVFTTQDLVDFPGGTIHTSAHVQHVFESIDSMISRANNLNEDINSAESYLLALSVLIHDLALIAGREGHSDVDHYEMVLNALDSAIPAKIKNLVIDIASAHSGAGGIEDLKKDTVKVYRSYPRADLRKIAAILRLADEVSEGEDRTSPVVPELDNIAEESVIYHLFAGHTICGFEEGYISIEITCPRRTLKEIRNKGRKERTLISFFLDRVIKIEKERLYCGRYIPRDLVPLRTKLRIQDDYSAESWCDITIPPNPDDLRQEVYEIDSSFLIPIVNEENVGYRKILELSLAECYSTSLISLIEFGSSARGETPSDVDYLLITDNSYTRYPNPLTEYVIHHVSEVYKQIFSLDVMRLQEFIYPLATGLPFPIAVTRDGLCLLNSPIFAAMKLMASQDLLFSRNDIVNQLLESVQIESEMLSLDATAYEHTQRLYRAITSMAQVVLLIISSEKTVPVNFIYQLSSVEFIEEELGRLKVPDGIDSGFKKAVRDFKRLREPSKTIIIRSPAQSRLDALEAWRSFTNMIVEEIGIDE